MKVILDPVPAAQTICAQQKKSENSTYRRTKLCVETDCPEGTLLFHTLTGMLLLLENQQDADNCRDELIQNWFLVPEDFDEASYADKFFSIFKMLNAGKNNRKNKTTFTIFTTTDCNARCYYCYQVGARRCSMSADTARAVADYIIRVSGGEEVQLYWFGGEPLVNSAVIDSICERLRTNGVSYKSVMTTNGYYLDQSVMEKAVGLWNLQKVQVTLDGTSEVYNRVKAYTNGGDAYARVLQNIENARSAGIEVHIRLNVSSDNIPELTRLADELAVRFPEKAGLSVYASFLGDFKGRTEHFNGDTYDADSYLKLKEKLKATGLDHISPLKRNLKKNGCKADNDACEVILPDGRLCKCEHELENECYGSVFTDERDLERLNSWKEQVKLPECFHCPLYARCFNLKKCAWVNKNCSKTIQKIRISTLQEQVLDTYNKWKENAQ